MNKENLKITSYESSISELPDYPSDKGYSARQLKELFDARSDGEIKEKHNALVDAFAEAEETASAHLEDKTNPHNVTKAQIGLSNVDNTSDMDKPISTSARALFDELSDRLEGVDELRKHCDENDNPHSVTKEQLGLSNVDNTSDAEKPISNSAKALFDELLERIEGVDEFRKHCDENDNPHSVTKEQLGLSNVDNTSDASKPMSDATRRYIGELNWKISPRKEVGYAKEHTLSDCVHGPFVKISLRGESAQAKTPSLTENQEIKGIGNPVITIKNASNSSEEISIMLDGILLNGISHIDLGWIAQDEILMSDEKVKLIRRCGMIEDVSSLDWVSGNTSGMYYAELDALRKGDFYGSGGFCTAFKYGASYMSESFTVGSDQIADASNCYVVFNTPFARLEDFKNEMKNQKLLYSLNESIETDITETAAGKALLSLCTKEPETHIVSDAEMAFTYASDMAAFLSDIGNRLSQTETYVNINTGDIMELRDRVYTIESRIFI